MPTMVETPNRQALVQRKGLFFPSPSHSIPISQTSSDSESTVDESIKKAQSIITKWDPNPSSNTIVVSSLFHHDRDEANEFLQTISNLRQAMHSLVSQTSSNGKLALAQKLMQIAMKRLEKEFYHILSTKSISSPPSGESNDFEDENETEPIKKVDQVSEVAMADLKLIADCMIRCGYRRECVKVYTIIRKSVVDEALYKLGIERYRSSHLHKMKPEALDRVIKTWLSAIKTVVRTIFSREQALCSHVFTNEPCFLEIIKEGATNVFRFPELIAKSKHSQSQERIFKLMEIHEAISDVWPEIDSIFTIQSASAIRSQALTSLLKLDESIRAILSDFETSIQRDSSKTLIPGGGIHPLTNSVMNYISTLAEYNVVLSDIVSNNPPSGTLQLPEAYTESPGSENGPTPALSAYLARLLLSLLCKIDSKTGVYKDVSLSYLFLANNLQFIITRVHTTKLRFLLGDEWIFSHAKKVVQYASSYQIMAWTKVFSSLPDKNFPIVTQEEVKECFRNFNAAFEEAYRKQTSWIIPDGKLRDEVKVCIAKNLVPVYQEFCETYLDMVRGEEDLEAVVRFAPDDLENYLSDLFHGASTSGSSHSSSPDSSAHLPGSLPR